ncbi:hypothetical protein [Bacillus sp. FJAT-29814]|uniref:hypothetical protein n=1 Tax=Bacillus sp. FJAT-29814 TaxID=1729688 RepID=UPI00082E6D17|nr:hypothetical protein [Bacillus sp. FJAT-29814]
MKSLKTKVVTGVVAVGLLSGVGAAFAGSNAGGILQGWYNAKFKNSSDAILSQATTDATTQIPAAMNSDYNGLKTAATTSINGTKTSEIGRVRTEVNKAKNEHLKALKDKKAEISGYMDEQFDAILAEAKTTINDAGDQALTKASSDLTAYTEKVGWDAYVDMNSQLASVEFDAIRELEDAIYYAKQDLLNQLDSESSATKQEIKDAIDAKIAELRTLITAKKDELVQAQQRFISDEAQKRLDQAMEDLNATVRDNINQN